MTGHKHTWNLGRTACSPWPALFPGGAAYLGPQWSFLLANLGPSMLGADTTPEGLMHVNGTLAGRAGTSGRPQGNVKDGRNDSRGAHTGSSTRCRH